MSPRKLIPLLLVMAVLVAAGLLPFLAPDSAPDLDGGNAPQPEAPKGVATLSHSAPPPTADQPTQSDMQDRQPIDAPADQPRTEVVILRADTREPVPGA